MIMLRFGILLALAAVLGACTPGSSPADGDTASGQDVLATPTSTSFTSTPQSRPSQTPPADTEPAARPTDDRPAACRLPSSADSVVVGDGLHLVGSEVTPGMYRSCAAGPRAEASCEWERQELGSQGVNTRIDGSNRAREPQLVTIEPTDFAFSSIRCGVWERIDTVTPRALLAAGDGIHLVGTELAPGIWRTLGGGPGERCEWYKLGWAGDELISAGDGYDLDLPTPHVTRIDESDFAFVSAGCGVWTTAPELDDLTEIPDGVFLVGSEIAPGLYRSDSPSPACEWERRAIDEPYPSTSVVALGGRLSELVEIDPRDEIFYTSGCGTWILVTEVEETPTETFIDGTWLVGTDISAGLYRSEGQTDAACSWSRLSDVSGFSSGFIEHSAGEGGGNYRSNETYRRGPHLVAIESSDFAFSSEGCGTWSVVQLTGNHTTERTVGDGIHIVGQEVQPGLYRNSPELRTSCIWERWGALTGSGDVLVADDGVAEQYIVTVESTDAAFYTNGCGRWTLLD